jgi:hypothetical protein
MKIREHRTLPIEPIFRFRAVKLALKRSIFVWEPGFPWAYASLPMLFCEVGWAMGNFVEMACPSACVGSVQAFAWAGDPRSRWGQRERQPPGNSRSSRPAILVHGLDCCRLQLERGRQQPGCVLTGVVGLFLVERQVTPVNVGLPLDQALWQPGRRDLLLLISGYIISGSGCFLWVRVLKTLIGRISFKIYSGLIRNIIHHLLLCRSKWALRIFWCS